MLYEFIFISLLFCRTSWVFVVRLPRSPVQVRPSNTSLPERDGRYYEILGDSRARHCFNWVRLLKRFKEKLVMPSGKVCCKARHRDTKTRMKALGIKTGNLFQIFESFERQCRLKVPSGHWTQCTERVLGVWKSAFSKLEKSQFGKNTSAVLLRARDLQTKSPWTCPLTDIGRLGAGLQW